MPLTDVVIRNTKLPKKGHAPKLLRDGKGLRLLIRHTGTRSWQYRYRIDDRENIYTIGEYFPDGRAGHVTLDDARKARAAARLLVKQGTHPQHQRRSEKASRIASNKATFEAMTREWLSTAGWTPRRRAQAMRWLERDVFPAFGSLPIRDVTSQMILECMRRVATGTGRERRPAPTVALQIRQYCSAVFRYAVANLKAKRDPTVDIRDAIKRPPVRKRRPPKRERITALIRALDNYPGDPVTAIALRLLMHTFVRQGELRGATWSEFDLNDATWRIPAERMKMREPHIVPLSAQAIALLRRLQAITGKREHPFPNHKRPRSFMGNTTLNAALVRIGFANELTPHGFRRLASTMLNEMGFRADVIERQLAHDERNSVRSSYNYAEYLPERHVMMQRWSDLLDSYANEESNVVPIGKVA